MVRVRVRHAPSAPAAPPVASEAAELDRLEVSDAGRLRETVGSAEQFGPRRVAADHLTGHFVAPQQLQLVPGPHAIHRELAAQPLCNLAYLSETNRSTAVIRGAQQGRTRARDTPRGPERVLLRREGSAAAVDERSEHARAREGAKQPTFAEILS